MLPQMGLASAARLVYLRAVRASLLLTVLLAGATLVVAPARAAEQTIEVLTPPGEQRVEALGGTEDLQNVVAVDEGEAQRVGEQVPPSPSAKAASRAGKFGLGVVAFVVSVGATVASLLLL
jgi:hypothetical protein